MDDKVRIKKQIATKKIKCNGCGRTFKLITNYKCHIIICEQLSDTKKFNLMLKDEEERIPSMEQMFYLLRNLIVKNDKLEHEVEKLKKYANITKKQINALDWLNDNIKVEIPYPVWCKNIELTRKHILNMFKYGYIEGIYQILEGVLPTVNTQQHPIKCFNQKTNIFYIYVDDGGWKLMTIDELNILVNIINGKVFKEFFKWKKENQERIDSDDSMYDEYTYNMRIVLGENKTNDQIIKSLKPKLYNYLKCDLKNIVKYEFTF